MRLPKKPTKPKLEVCTLVGPIDSHRKSGNDKQNNINVTYTARCPDLLLHLHALSKVPKCVVCVLKWAAVTRILMRSLTRDYHWCLNSEQRLTMNNRLQATNVKLLQHKWLQWLRSDGFTNVDCNFMQGEKPKLFIDMDLSPFRKIFFCSMLCYPKYLLVCIKSSSN